MNLSMPDYGKASARANARLQRLEDQRAAAEHRDPKPITVARRRAARIARTVGESQ